jgi:hypothetical protein
MMAPLSGYDQDLRRPAMTPPGKKRNSISSFRWIPENESVDVKTNINMNTTLIILVTLANHFRT